MPYRDVQSGRITTPPAVAPPPGDELTRTRTGDQGSNGHAYLNPLFAMGGGVCGGTAANPCGFPGWGGSYYGTYQTYRWMLNHPVIRLARSIALVPLTTNTWAIDPAREDLPAEAEGWGRHLRDCILPQRAGLIKLALSSTDMGCAFGEKVWSVRNGRWWVNVKWLLNDITEVVTDKGGNFRGLWQPGVDGSDYLATAPDGSRAPALGPYKALIVTHDFTPDVGYYGRSRLENIRDYAWRPWVATMQRLAKLGDKLSGTIGILFGPAGEFTDAKTGAKVAYRDMAAAAVKALLNNQFAYFPTVALSSQDASGKVDLDRLAALVKTSLINLQVVDAGSHAPAIGGFLSLLDHYESLMFAGWLRSVRTGTDTAHGSRADAEVHTDTGVADSEAIDDDIAAQVTTGLVDDVLVLNHGERARGAFKITAPPLVSGRMAQLREFLRLLMGNPTLALAIAKSANMDEVLRSLDIPAGEEPFVAPEGAGANEGGGATEGTEA